LKMRKADGGEKVTRIATRNREPGSAPHILKTIPTGSGHGRKNAGNPGKADKNQVVNKLARKTHHGSGQNSRLKFATGQWPLNERRKAQEKE